MSASVEGSLPERCDVIVVGSGIGGLASAVTAAEGGCSVVVLEKAPVLGGTSGISGGQLWVPANHRMAAQGIEDSVEEGVEYLASLAGEFYANRDRSQWLIEQANETIRYLEDVTDLSTQIIRGLPDYHTSAPGAQADGRYLEPEPFDGPVPDWAEIPHSPQIPGGMTNDELLAWGGPMVPDRWDWDQIEKRRSDGTLTKGAALIGIFLSSIESMSVTVQTDTAVTELLTDGERIAGVRAEHDGNTLSVEANRGVVLNTGAYDWNPELVEELEGTPADHVGSAAIPTATGDGLRMAALEGAKLGVYPPIGGAKGFFVAVPDSEFLDEPLYRYCYNVGLPHAVAVNADGERFCDESFYPDQSSEFYDPTGEYDGYPHYMIFDETYRQQYPIGNYRPGATYPDSFLDAKADSLDALAQKLDIDAGTLRGTVETFNRHARNGEDPAYGRGENEWAQIWCGDPEHEPNPNLGPVDQPPFYAVRLYIGLSSMSNTGLVPDRNNQVLDWNDEPIPGLYATGSVCAPIEWGIGYQSGLQNARSLTGGYLAGKQLSDGEP